MEKILNFILLLSFKKSSIHEHFKRKGRKDLQNVLQFGFIKGFVKYLLECIAIQYFEKNTSSK